MTHVTPHPATSTLLVRVGPVELHVHALDAQIFSNVLRRPPTCGLTWQDALDGARGVRLRAVGDGTELTGTRRGEADTPPERITWTVAVDIVGEITGQLGRLRGERAAS